MQCTWQKASMIALVALVLSSVDPAAWAQEAESEERESGSNGFRLGSQRTWLFRSFLKDEGDDADTLGLEFESYLSLGNLEIKNISYFEVNAYPRAIPGQPPGNPTPGMEAANGINDLLTAFWFSKKSPHHGKHHFAPGVAAQLPTASDDTLGSGKWSIGPSFDYEYESGRVFAGAIALQVWSFAGDSARKDVNMLMIKPFFVYKLTDRWDLLYMPMVCPCIGTNPRARRCISHWGEGRSGAFNGARCR